MVWSSNEKLPIGYTIIRNISNATSILKNNEKRIFKMKQCFEFAILLESNIDLIKKIIKNKFYQFGPYQIWNLPNFFIDQR